MYRGSLSRGRLEEALSGHAEWFMWEDRRVYLPGNRLYKALEMVHRSRRAVTLKTLSDAAGVGVRRVRDWIRAMGEDVDSWLASQALEEDAEELVDTAKLSAWLAFSQAVDEACQVHREGEEGLDGGVEPVGYG